MDRLAEAIERRCEAGEVGGAVRLVDRAADELTRTFKELMVQRLIDATVRRELGDKRRKRRRREQQRTPPSHVPPPAISDWMRSTTKSKARSAGSSLSVPRTQREGSTGSVQCTPLTAPRRPGKRPSPDSASAATTRPSPSSAMVTRRLKGLSPRALSERCPRSRGSLWQSVWRLRWIANAAIRSTSGASRLTALNLRWRGNSAAAGGCCEG